MVGVFNVLSEDNSNMVQSVYDIKEVPVVEARLDTTRGRESYITNLFPNVAVLARAYAEILNEWNFQGFTILYENQENLVMTAELLNIYKDEEHTVVVRQLDPENTGNYR